MASLWSPHTTHEIHNRMGDSQAEMALASQNAGDFKGKMPGQGCSRCSSFLTRYPFKPPQDPILVVALFGDQLYVSTCFNEGERGYPKSKEVLLVHDDIEPGSAC